MKLVVEKLKEVLDVCDIKDVDVLVILNVFVDVMIEKVDIKEKFIEQFYFLVCFEESINKLIVEGVMIFIEIGFGKVFLGFVKKVNRWLKIIVVLDLEMIELVI